MSSIVAPFPNLWLPRPRSWIDRIITPYGIQTKDKKRKIKDKKQVVANAGDPCCCVTSCGDCSSCSDVTPPAMRLTFSGVDAGIITTCHNERAVQLTGLTLDGEYTLNCVSACQWEKPSAGNLSWNTLWDYYYDTPPDKVCSCAGLSSTPYSEGIYLKLIKFATTWEIIADIFGGSSDCGGYFGWQVFREVFTPPSDTTLCDILWTGIPNDNANHGGCAWPTYCASESGTVTIETP